MDSPGGIFENWERVDLHNSWRTGGIESLWALHSLCSIDVLSTIMSLWQYLLDRPKRVWVLGRFRPSVQGRFLRARHDGDDTKG